MKFVLIILLVFITLFNNLYSTTIKVPQSVSTIQAGIDGSSNGDTVLVSPGTYFENINFNGKNIVLGSLFLTTGDTSHISQTIIDGNEQGCVIVFESGEDSTATLTGFTITNGYSYQDSLRGGGITCINSSNPKLTNLVVENNEIIGMEEDAGGGGIYCLRQSSPKLANLVIRENLGNHGYGAGIYCKDSSNISLINVVITENKFPFRGGGIAIVKSSISVSESQIINNSARHGAGIFIENSTLNIYDSFLNKNLSRNGYGALGGGIFAINSNVLIKDTDINNNNTEAPSEPNSQGGGVYAINCSLVIENCTISRNTSQGSGGGISIKSSKTRICNTLISNNTALGFSNGGGINVSYASGLDNLFLEDVLIVGNSSSGYGGGILYYPKEKTNAFKNVTIKNNFAGRKGGGLSSTQKLIISDSSNCSIYLNRAKEGGADINIEIFNSILNWEIYLDTVTVSNSRDYQICPMESVDLHYNQAIFQTVDSDLYVSPSGSDSNTGSTKNTALKTINFALLVADADSFRSRTIFLASGTYSSTSNGEEFPLIGRSYICIKGERADKTILDGEDKTNLIELTKCNNVTLENFTVQNGYSYYGGGIYINGQKILLKNLVIKDNFAERSGGGLFFAISDQVDLINLTIANNSSNEANSSGGIYYFDYHLKEGRNLSILNSIIHNNTPVNIELESLAFALSTTLIGYSNIEDGQEGIITSDSVNIYWAEGNIDLAPSFVGGNPFNYNLSDSSLSINAGTPFLVWEGDTIINLSPSEYIGEAPDMGALESDVLISVESKAELPTEFKLEQNFPNPFNPSTTIKYSIPASINVETSVRLNVYDVLGREVATLVNKEQQPGDYEVQFDASGLTSGIYFYRLKTDGFSLTNKMLLIQ